MKTHSTRTRLLASSMIGGAAVLASGQAFAQDQGTQVEEFVVTGSRIPQPNLTSTSPITVVGNDEARLQGTTNVETLINNLPQAFADYGQTVSNGATGTATVNLRDLGAVRTLVLVDGKRLMPADPALPVADLNAIPAALVDHVEVVTGGASAVYGSDALAGVVNFIMKKDFEGVRIDAQYGFVQHNQHNDLLKSVSQASGVQVPDDFSGGQTWDVTAIVGVNSPDGKGNATVYAGYRHIDAVTEDKYDYANCSTAVVGANNDSFICAGSGSSNRFRQIGGNLNPGYFVNTDGTLRPYNANTDAFNFAPYNFFQRPDERYVLGGFAHYEITPMFDAYTDVMFSDDHTIAQLAPSGLFGQTFDVPCSNALLSADEVTKFCTSQGLGTADTAQILIGRRAVESGPRQDDLRHTSYRIDLGLRGDLGHGWSYDVYGQYGTTIYVENFLHDWSLSKSQKALNVVDVGGVPTCQSVVDGSDPACVPLDIFHGYGGISPAAVAYVELPSFKQGSTTEQIVSGSLTGDLGQYGMKSPYASDGVGVALGVEYRREAVILKVDAANLSGDLSGAGGATPPANGAYDVKEAFGEIRIPLVQDAAFAKLLQVEAGYRHSDYSTAGATNAWKLAADWQPIDDIRLRASFQRAVRAPNILELFTPRTVGLLPGQDPCSGANPTASLADCEKTGATAGQYGQIPECTSSQCNALYGGNAALRPETSDTKSFGVVFTPTFLRGFNASIDYFDIKVEDRIGFAAGNGAGLSLNQCISTGDPFFCSLIHRDPVTGAVSGDPTGFIDNHTVNTGFLRTKGIDLEANYRTSFSDMGMGDMGGLSFNFVGTYTDSFEVQQVSGIDTFDCAGLYGTTCGNPVPQWRHKLRVTWTTPWNVGLSVNWRHMSSVQLDFNTSNPLLQTGNHDTIDDKIKAYDWFDLAGTWTVRDGTTIRFGVNNVFDKDPPIVDSNSFGVASPPFGNGNTFPGVYDSLGRTFFVGITADF